MKCWCSFWRREREWKWQWKTVCETTYHQKCIIERGKTGRRDEEENGYEISYIRAWRAKLASLIETYTKNDGEEAV